MDETRLRDHLASAYGVEVRGTAALEDGVVRVDRADGPPWVARAFRAGRPMTRAEGDAAVLGFVEAAGLPAERCAHPAPVTEAGGRAVLVTTFVPGSPACNDDATRRALGDLLGRLHALPVPDGGPVARPAGSLHHDPRHEGGPGEDLASAAAHLAGVESRVPPAGRAAFEALRDDVAAADACADLPAAVVHPDPVLKNAIATPGGPALVDWTGAGLGPRVTSLVVLLHGGRRARGREPRRGRPGRRGLPRPRGARGRRAGPARRGPRDPAAVARVLDLRAHGRGGRRPHRARVVVARPVARERGGRPGPGRVRGA